MVGSSDSVRKQAQEVLPGYQVETDTRVINENDGGGGTSPQGCQPCTPTWDLILKAEGDSRDAPRRTGVRGSGGKKGQGPGGSVCTFEVQKYPMYLPIEPSFPWLLPIPATTPPHTHTHTNLFSRLLCLPHAQTPGFWSFSRSYISKHLLH